ncbi:MAG TPA: hypothetical protein VNI77_08040 [Nitrososphaera sp.]|nr:hypothetical protein [Nitrososphaera sp.]
MARFPAYGMAGVGIAAAIGFVFALTLLNNNPAINPELSDQRQEEAITFRQTNEADSNGIGRDDASKLADDQEQSAQLMMRQEEDVNVPPMLTSIMASDAKTGEVIGEVTPGMLFVLNEPVVIQANFVNQNEVSGHLITLAISKNDDRNSQPAYHNAANVRGTIGAGSDFMLELYWNPTSTGEHTLILSIESVGKSAQPLAEIPIRVVETAVD